MSFKGFTRVLVVLSVVLWADSAHAMLLTDGLVAYWNLDEASGTRLDSVGSNHLADNNTVTQAPGIKNGAAKFTSANVEFLKVADNPSINTNDTDFTVALWAYLDDKNTSYSFIEKGVEFEIGYEGPPGIDRMLLLVQEPTVQINSDAFGSPPIGEWMFAVAWKDIAAGTVNLQLNNGIVESAAFINTSINPMTPLQIGARSSPSRPLNGRVDEVGLWKRVLSAEERTALYEEPGVLDREIPSAPIIPEPSSLLLLGSGLLGLAGWRRRLF